MGQVLLVPTFSHQATQFHQLSCTSATFKRKLFEARPKFNSAKMIFEVWRDLISHIYINIYIYVIIFLDVYHSLWLMTEIYSFLDLFGGFQMSNFWRSRLTRLPEWIDRCWGPCAALLPADRWIDHTLSWCLIKKICCVDHFWRNHDGWWNMKYYEIILDFLISGDFNQSF